MSPFCSDTKLDYQDQEKFKHLHLSCSRAFQLPESGRFDDLLSAIDAVDVSFDGVASDDGGPKTLSSGNPSANRTAQPRLPSG